MSDNTIRVQTDSDTKKLISQLNALKKNTIKVTIDTSGAEKAKGHFSDIFNLQGIIADIPGQMWSAVSEIDKAMTELQTVSGVSNSQARELMATYSQLGSRLKVTAADAAASGTEWLKQGQSIENANKLAQSTMILSKIGGMSSKEASSVISSAMKSYSIGVDGVMDFVDKLSAIDMESAVDTRGLSAAFSEVSESARGAGIEVEKVLSYAAAIGETTHADMSKVGTSLSEIFTRMGNIKLSALEDTRTGEDLSGVEASLRRVGIQLRESNGEFRDFDDVIGDAAGRWNSFNESAQRSIAGSLAGPQNADTIMALIQNYDNALKYMDSAQSASGSSMEKYEAYTSSLSGKMEGLANSFQTFSSAALNSDVFGFLINTGTQFLNVLTGIVDAAGMLPAAAGAFSAWIGTKGYGKQKVIVFNALSYKAA